MTRFIGIVALLPVLVSMAAAQEKKSELSNYEHLKHFEWLVGSWESTGTVPAGDKMAGQKYVFRASHRWVLGKNALVFDLGYVAPEKRSGKLLVGWDPEAKQIASFGFGSTGSHGKGVLKIDENSMRGLEAGFRADGTEFSYDVELVRKDKDTLIRKITKRREGDKELPDIEDVMRRVAD